jgi:Protein of unknown function (DUF3108)
MKKIFCLIGCIFVCSSGFAQIKAGERLVFSGAYNMSGILTPLAQITMTTSNMATAKGNYLHLSCEAATYARWDSFFKIRDTYESYVNPTTLMPSLYKRNINEGGFKKTEKYIFKGTSVTSTSKRNTKPETTKTFSVGESTQDIVAAIYKMRTIDFASMKVGQSKSMVIVFDEVQLPVVVKYMGTETVAAGNLGSKSCYKIAIAAKTDALKGTDKNLMWLTADENKVPVSIKFSIKVGVGQLSLTSATGI